MSKPASAAMAWMSSATWRVSDTLGTIMSTTTGVVAPASLSKALALATSRFGTGNSLMKYGFAGLCH